MYSKKKNRSHEGSLDATGNRVAYWNEVSIAKWWWERRHKRNSKEIKTAPLSLLTWAMYSSKWCNECNMRSHWVTDQNTKKWCEILVWFNYSTTNDGWSHWSAIGRVNHAHLGSFVSGFVKALQAPLTTTNAHTYDLGTWPDNGVEWCNLSGCVCVCHKIQHTERNS